MVPEQVTFSAPLIDECLSVDQKKVLERAVAKIVLMGEQVGISPDDMIVLLQGGLTVRELLDYIAASRQVSA